MKGKFSICSPFFSLVCNKYVWFWQVCREKFFFVHAETLKEKLCQQLRLQRIEKKEMILLSCRLEDHSAQPWLLSSWLHSAIHLSPCVRPCIGNKYVQRRLTKLPWEEALHNIIHMYYIIIYVYDIYLLLHMICVWFGLTLFDFVKTPYLSAR